MKKRKKNRFVFLSAALACSAAFSQTHVESGRITRLEPFGLPGKHVVALDLATGFTPYLYAATDSHGVYRRAISPPDSAWINLGLQGKRLTAFDVQVWGAGPAIFHTPVAGVQPDFSRGDSTLIYRYDNKRWVPADSGIVRNRLYNFIFGLAGFESSGHEPPGFTFASTGVLIYRSQTRSSKWNRVFGNVEATDQPSVNALAVKQDGWNNEVWIGGYTGLSFQPWIAKSVDMGSTWQGMPINLNLGVENGCHAFAFHPVDTATVYAGMDGTIIKTVNGGKTWLRTALRDTLLAHFSGLALDPFRPQHIYAGGRLVVGDLWVLWESFDAGVTWQKVVPPLPFSLRGITRIVADPFVPGMIYLATAGNGVWRYQSEGTAVKDQRDEAEPRGFELEQNYPNPFNTGTVIRFAITARLANQSTRLAIYNLRGELVRELINKKLSAGQHDAHWEGKDGAGHDMASGIYLYRLQVGKIAEMRKLTLLK